MPTTTHPAAEFSSEALISARRAAGFTRAETARRAELDPSQLWRIEVRGVVPREATALRLAHVLGVPIDTFFRAA